MRLALIWAMSRNRVIGAGGGLPWRLPDEMRHFQRTTRDKPVIMGRRTFATMAEPLPRRSNIVLTRSPDFSHAGVEVVHDLAGALAVASKICARDNCDEAVVIGGAEVYALALPVADRLYQTVIDAEFEGDVYFPEYPEDDWLELERHPHPVDERHPYRYTTHVLERAV
ncbi:MAG: dihydrofolate reductase [Gammaproteobacteria bacterium]|nr:MAG: dihydrofolate reductase [Gammaproteobacteria bacterium]